MSTSRELKDFYETLIPDITDETFKNISIDDESINLLLLASNQLNQLQRFAVVDVIEDKEGRVLHHLFFQPTLHSSASEEDMLKAEKIYGKGRVIKANAELTGIVHPKTLELRRKQARIKKAAGNYSDNYLINQGRIWVKDEEDCIDRPLCLGLSCVVYPHPYLNTIHIRWIGRSTMQYDLFDLNQSAEFCFLFAEFDRLNWNGFDYKRKFTSAFHIERTVPPLPFKYLIEGTTAILQSKLQNSKQITAYTEPDDTSQKVSDHLREWAQIQAAQDKAKIATYFLETIYIISGIPIDSPGKFWIPETDERIVELTLREAKKLTISINLNQIPEKFQRNLYAVPALCFAIRLGKEELVKCLILNGAELNLAWLEDMLEKITPSPTDKRIYNFLVVHTLANFIKKNLAIELKKLLAIATQSFPYGKINLNTPLEDDYTPLMLAAKEGHLDVIKVLLEEKVDLNFKNSQNQTAISIAKYYKKDLIVEFLNPLLPPPVIPRRVSLFRKCKRKLNDVNVEPNRKGVRLKLTHNS